MSFEDDVKVTEEEIARLESGKLTLEEVLEAYTRGRAALDSARKQLDKADVKLEELTDDA